MSKKQTKSRCLVVDASVARAAGRLESPHPVGRRCRNFLMEVRGICHRMAWSPPIETEWQKHESIFAMSWRVSMMNLRKLVPVDIRSVTTLGDRITMTSVDPSVVAIVEKDFHLMEAAGATDMRIVSLDDNARGHFHSLIDIVPALARVLWVNPAIEDEQAVRWLQEGAPDERRRRLGHR